MRPCAHTELTPSPDGVFFGLTANYKACRQTMKVLVSGGKSNVIRMFDRTGA